MMTFMIYTDVNGISVHSHIGSNNSFPLIKCFTILRYMYFFNYFHSQSLSSNVPQYSSLCAMVDDMLFTLCCRFSFGAGAVMRTGAVLPPARP